MASESVPQELQLHDVERIVRDVLSLQGLPVSLLHVDRTDEGWRLVFSDVANRVVSTDVPAAPSAAIRAALEHWAASHC